MDSILSRALELLEFEDTPTNRDQLMVFIRSMRLFEERNKKYGDLWKEYGWRGNLLHVQSKAARVRKVWWDQATQPPGDQDLDDAFDLINYAAFFIRNVEEGNELGTQ